MCKFCAKLPYLPRGNMGRCSKTTKKKHFTRVKCFFFKYFFQLSVKWSQEGWVRDIPLFLKNISLVRGNYACKDSFLNFEFLAIYLSFICAVGQTCGHFDSIGNSGDVYDGCAFLSTIHIENVSVG